MLFIGEAQAQHIQLSEFSIPEFILSVIPWIIFFVILLLLVRKMNRNTAAHLERSRLHMIAVEQKLDRLIEQGDRRSPSPPPLPGETPER